ncbi:MAG: YdaU family protein [Promethearchaeota archaeon]
MGALYFNIPNVSFAIEAPSNNNFEVKMTGSKSSPIYMPMYWNDWMGDTSTLTFMEQGAYCMLVRMYWNNGGKIAEKMQKICRGTGAQTRSEKAALKHILCTYFILEDGYYIHPRIDKELKQAIEKTKEKSKQAREAANARWQKKGIHEHMRTHKQTHMRNDCVSNANQPKGYIYNNRPIDNNLPAREKNNISFPIWEMLSDEAREQAEYYAEGWDIDFLEKKYNAWFPKNGGMPKDLNKAFPAWVQKFTKGCAPK